jgi:hypothetical protein
VAWGLLPWVRMWRQPRVRSLWRLVAAARDWIGATARARAGAVGSLLTHLAYRRRELGVLAFLAGSLLGGLGVERWRLRHPDLAERLEAEAPRFRTRPAPAPGGAARLPPREGPDERPTGGRDRPAAPLDLNRASIEDLVRLPGIGPRLAERIATWRTERGGRFESTADLARIPGVGRRRAEALAPHLTVGSGSPCGGPGPPAPPPRGSR